jgi:hypothetical protein
MNLSELCWFQAHLDGIGPCSGRLVKCHLLPRQLLKREGYTWAIDDDRSWVPGCGGPMGNAGHHGMLDTSRTLRIPRSVVPSYVEELAEECGLGWWLDREYGPREMAA